MIDENLSSSAKVRLGNTEGAGSRTAADIFEAPIDEEIDAIDGCDVDIQDETPDEELPPTQGGVA